jgi:hypothetical protein
MQLLIEKFPFKKSNIELHCCYFKTILEISKKCPSSEEKIIDICIDKFIQIDIEVKQCQKCLINSSKEIEEKINV